jgi:hypothetical protein
MLALFFARCVVFAVILLPERGELSKNFHKLVVYGGCKKKVIAWHKKNIEWNQAKLEKLDPVLLLQKHNPDLVLHWEEALARHPETLIS